jgi:hypothetical protein
LCLVIDKPIRDLLGIKRDSILRVTTDGRRLLIEPTGESTLPPSQFPSDLDPLPVYWALMDDFSMSQREFAALHHDPKFRFTTYLGWLEWPRVEPPTPQEVATIERFKACLLALRAGQSWADATATARAAFPIV